MGEVTGLNAYSISGGSCCAISEKHARLVLNSLKTESKDKTTKTELGESQPASTNEG